MDSHGWLDIGYHILVDARGRLYLGRPTDRLGAHVLNENTGRVGINFMQDGRSHPLTPSQKKTLRKLFRHEHARLGLPALEGSREAPGLGVGRVRAPGGPEPVDGVPGGPDPARRASHHPRVLVRKVRP
jgi:hypothetical protein